MDDWIQIAVLFKLWRLASLSIFDFTKDRSPTKIFKKVDAVAVSSAKRKEDEERISKEEEVIFFRLIKRWCDDRISVTFDDADPFNFNLDPTSFYVFGYLSF